MDPTDPPSSPPRTPNPAQPPIHTPHHLTTVKTCICNDTRPNCPLIRCSTCRSLYHDECVCLKSLRTVIKPNDAGVLVLDGWACPECIVSARLLQPGSPIFDAIATKAAELFTRMEQPTFMTDCSRVSHSQHAWSRADSNNLTLLDVSHHSPQSEISSKTAASSTDTPSSSSSSASHLPPVSNSVTNANASSTGTSNATYADVAKKLPPQPRVTIQCADVKSTRELVNKALESVPISHVKNFASSIRIWFPNENAQKLAEENLMKADILKDTTRLSTAIMSKVTLRFVPVEMLPDDATQEDSRQFCLEKLKAKNPCLRNCKDLSVVYFKRTQNNPSLATVALKLPVEVKDQLLASGRVFFDMTSVKVYHRVHIKRCPHCQSLGHYPDRCPNRGKPPTCMFCSKDHTTDSCPVKEEPGKHVCKNCIDSNHDEHSHHAGSVKCPTYKNEYDRLSKNFHPSSTLH